MYISKMTGGEYFHVKNTSGILETYNNIFRKISYTSTINIVESLNTQIVKEIIDRNNDLIINRQDMDINSCGALPVDLNLENISILETDNRRKLLINIKKLEPDQAVCLSFDVKIDEKASNGDFSVDNRLVSSLEECSEPIPSDSVFFVKDGACYLAEFPLVNITVEIPPPPYIDCGLRIQDDDKTITPACEPAGTLTSPLRIHKNGTTYGVVLVEPSDPNASGIRIQTRTGLKALRKFP